LDRLIEIHALIMNGSDIDSQALINELNSIAEENNLEIVIPDDNDADIYDLFESPEESLGKLIGRLIYMLNQ